MSRLSAISLPLIAVALAILMLGVFTPRDAHALPAVYVVTKDTDSDDGFCNADCSLREAVTAANADGVDSTIELDGTKTYQLTIAGQFDDLNHEGDLDVSADVTINGNGATVKQTIPDRVFNLYPVVLIGGVVINNLTITGGNEVNLGGGGGGIKIDEGTLTLNGVTVSANATATYGGGIFRGKDAIINITGDSVIKNNTATQDGGGLYEEDGGSGSLTATNATFSGNQGDQGGGLLLAESTTNSLTNTTISGNTSHRAPCGCAAGGGGIFGFASTGSVNLTITGGNITGNHAGASGGGVYSEDMTMSGTTVDSNTAGDYGGGVGGYGGITGATIIANTAKYGGGVVLEPSTVKSTITDTTISGNHASSDGGGVYGFTNFSISGSTISTNTAVDSGGGIAVSQGTAQVTNSTIDSNTADRGGGVAKESDSSFESLGGATPQGGVGPGTLSLLFTTVYNNTGTSSGGSVFFESQNGALDISASIIGKSNISPDCNTPTLSSLGYNVEQGTGCGLGNTADVTGVDPLLGPLANNGGLTKTRAVLQNSPAINRVPVLTCSGTATDQRGIARPVGSACDSGSYESVFLSSPGPTSTGTPTPTPSPTASPTHSPTPSPTAVTEDKVWDDDNCTDTATAADAGVLLAHVAGLPDPEGCTPAIGQSVKVDGITRKWGDTNCDGTVDAVDALSLLQQDAALDGGLADGCPVKSQNVSVSPS